MNQKKARLIRKYSRYMGLFPKAAKKYYLSLNCFERFAFSVIIKERLKNGKKL